MIAFILFIIAIVTLLAGRGQLAAGLLLLAMAIATADAGPLVLLLAAVGLYLLAGAL